MRRGASVTLSSTLMAEQVELLEHHAHLAALALQGGVVVAHLDAVNGDAPAVVGSSRLMARSSVLARAGGADDHRHLAGMEHGGHVLSTWCAPNDLHNPLGHDVGLGWLVVAVIGCALPRQSGIRRRWDLVTSVVSSR